MKTRFNVVSIENSKRALFADQPLWKIYDNKLQQFRLGAYSSKTSAQHQADKLNGNLKSHVKECND